MSLKGVHIVFIISAIIVMIFFGIWSFQYYSNAKDIEQLITAIGSFTLAAVLMVYGILVAKKLKVNPK